DAPTTRSGCPNHPQWMPQPPVVDAPTTRSGRSLTRLGAGDAGGRRPDGRLLRWRAVSAVAEHELATFGEDVLERDRPVVALKIEPRVEALEVRVLHRQRPLRARRVDGDAEHVVARDVVDLEAAGRHRIGVLRLGDVNPAVRALH